MIFCYEQVRLSNTIISLMKTVTHLFCWRLLRLCVRKKHFHKKRDCQHNATIDEFCHSEYFEAKILSPVYLRKSEYRIQNPIIPYFGILSPVYLDRTKSKF